MSGLHLGRGGSAGAGCWAARLGRRGLRQRRGHPPGGRVPVSP